MEGQAGLAALQGINMWQYDSWGIQTRVAGVIAQSFTHYATAV